MALSALLLPFLVLLVLSSLKRAAGASSSTADLFCSTEAQACMGDDDCYVCLNSWTPDSSCEDYSSVETTTEQAVSGEGSAVCEDAGASYCCGFASGTAESCMENAALEAYWECNLKASGCALLDMPCSVAGVVAS